MNYSVYLGLKGNQVLYVGQTESIKSRLENHKANKVWFDECDRVIYTNFENRTTARFVESYLILKFKTPHNISGISNETLVGVDLCIDNMVWWDYFDKSQEVAPPKFKVDSKDIKNLVRSYHFNIKERDKFEHLVKECLIELLDYYPIELQPTVEYLVKQTNMKGSIYISEDDLSSILGVSPEDLDCNLSKLVSLSSFFKSFYSFKIKDRKRYVIKVDEDLSILFSNL